MLKKYQAWIQESSKKYRSDHPALHLTQHMLPSLAFLHINLRVKIASPCIAFSLSSIYFPVPFLNNKHLLLVCCGEKAEVGVLNIGITLLSLRVALNTGFFKIRLARLSKSEWVGGWGGGHFCAINS